MRIVCQKCSAAYAIDDKYVTPKGIRAQCPRCRHLQLVKKDGADAMVPDAPSGAAPALPPLPASQVAIAAPPPPPPSLPDFPPPPAPSPMPGPGGASPFLFDLEAPMPKPGAVMPPPAAVPPPRAAPPAAAAVPDALDFGDLDLGPPPPLAAPPAPAAVVNPAPVPAVSEVVKCKSCGKVLSDPFDQALGTCDDCRAAASNASDSPFDEPPGAPPPEPATEQHEQVPEPEPAPMAPPEPAPEAPQALGRIKTVKVEAHAAEPSLDVAAPRGPGPAAARTGSGAQVSAARPGADSGGGRGKMIGIAAGVVVLGIGATLAITRPWVRKPSPVVVRSTSPGSEKPIDRAVDQWKLSFPELTGSAEDHLVAAEEQLAKDTSQGYAEAEEEFRKALVLDKSSDRAVAGWVLALAFGQGAQLDDATATTADEVLKAAEARNAAPRVFIAHAHLLLAHNGPLNDVEVYAERGKVSINDRDKALAYLALGQAFIGRNPNTADEHLREAVKLDPKLKRAYFFQSKLMMTQGKYKDAVSTIEKRLELDPDQWEATEELVKLRIDMGDLPGARKLLEKVKTVLPNNFRVRLALPLLAYQHEGDVAGAIAQLQELVADPDKLEKENLGEALGHLAAAQRLAGQLDSALASADRALKAKPTEVNASLQKLLVTLEQGRPADARALFDSIKGKLQDPALEQALDGRVLYGEGLFQRAMSTLASAYEKDNRRTDALLLAAAAGAKLKNEGKAYEYGLTRGLKADPWYGGPTSPLARNFVRSADLLKDARGAFEGLRHDEEDPNPETCEGLVAWFANDYVNAEKHFTRLVQIDPANGPGFAYRTFVALRKKDVSGAMKFGAKAVDAERQLGLAHLAAGMALLQAGQIDPAKKELRKAVELEPGLKLARVKLAEVEGKQGKAAEARPALTNVLLADPLYAEAKRVLFTLP